MLLKGYIDSITLDLNYEILAKLSEIGIIKVAKNGLALNQELLMEFKTISKARWYDYLAFYHTQRGLKYEITKQSVSKYYKLVFRGLRQYSEVSKLMRDDLKEVAALIGDNLVISRLDICFDQDKPFDISKIAKIFKRRIYRPKNTTTFYLKTQKEAKSNKHLNIKSYKKGMFYRLEFVFGKRYLNGNNDEVKNRCSKVIKKAIKKPFKFESVSCLLSSFPLFLPKQLTNADNTELLEAI